MDKSGRLKPGLSFLGCSDGNPVAWVLSFLPQGFYLHLQVRKYQIQICDAAAPASLTSASSFQYLCHRIGPQGQYKFLSVLKPADLQPEFAQKPPHCHRASQTHRF